MRSNTLDAAQRAYLGLTRGIIMSTDDSGPLQVVSARLLPNELPTQVERVQQYGFSSVPVDPDQNGASGAEAVFGFMHGNRSHPVVMAVDDRRTRPTNWKSGESGLWHYSGATCKFTDAGWQHDQGPKKQPISWTVGNDVVTIADQKFTAQVGGSGGPAVVVKADMVYLGGDPDQGGTFDFVMTASGPSTKVKAKL